MPVETITRVPRSRRRPHVVQVCPRQIRSRTFFGCLKWLDGRKVLDLLPPVWHTILTEALDTVRTAVRAITELYGAWAKRMRRRWRSC